MLELCSAFCTDDCFESLTVTTSVQSKPKLLVSGDHKYVACPAKRGRETQDRTDRVSRVNEELACMLNVDRHNQMKLRNGGTAVL